MPIRKIPKNYRNVTGVAASGKAVGSAQFESTLERDFLALLDFSPEVGRYEVQPIKIEWRNKHGNIRSYTPDVLIEFIPELNRCPWLCEVKYRADIKKNWATLRPKFKQAIRYAKQHSWRFRLITEVEIRTPLLANVRFLAAFRLRDIPATDIETLLAALSAAHKTTPGSLLQTITNDVWRRAEYIPALWHLLAHHRIGADLNVELTMDSPIWSLS
ncbi:MAG: TnsA endonuclease N-terminal domain-containing protein [Betaproteobacteria bacterium]|nr:TnsA endonuclease N-terminal domain-containing protein [Betaproteobacteria bacterium]